MIWIVIGLLAVAALAPLAVALDRRATARGERDLAIGLHRAQLLELDRDLAEGRIMPAEHATAVLEVQRRLLAVADQADRSVRIGSRAPIFAVIVLTPVAALGLYLVGGQPNMPSVAPGAGEAQQQRMMDEAALIEQLRDRLATMDPASDQTRQGYILLGNAEASRGNDAAAAAAWRQAMGNRFDPEIAVRIAEAALRVEGSLSPSSIALLRRSLAAGAPDAPWRKTVEEQLRQVKP
jgi:cytochrome c-type biogenesis protein CcmH